jgi:inorganic pyrophosphatase
MRLASAALAALFAGAAAAQTGFVHPFAFPQPEEGSDFFAVIEIPAGSITKYEVDGDTGHVLVDRYMSMPVVYPANYGSIPSSLGGDGDPLDALVLSREPIAPGALIKVRAIGVLGMIDGGETDDKIIAVPASDIDPTFDAIASVDDLPEMERLRIEGFFRVYKELPDPADAEAVELSGFRGGAEATEIVLAALAAYREAPAD